jgi:hypothetical protein
MVYNTQDYWVFWTFPSSGILETRKHDVSETGRKLRTQTDPVSKMYILVSRIPDDGKVQKNPIILNGFIQSLLSQMPDQCL